eukprot:5804652-Pyramimonas_sp.AAC.1
MGRRVRMKETDCGTVAGTCLSIPHGYSPPALPDQRHTGYVGIVRGLGKISRFELPDARRGPQGLYDGPTTAAAPSTTPTEAPKIKSKRKPTKGPDRTLRALGRPQEIPPEPPQG